MMEEGADVPLLQRFPSFVQAQCGGLVFPTPAGAHWLAARAAEWPEVLAEMRDTLEAQLSILRKHMDSQFRKLERRLVATGRVRRRCRCAAPRRR